MKDAVIVASGRIDGYEAIVAAMEYGFIGGSMGVVVGEKITRGIERALATRRPMIIVSCSGGARMMEGALSLMQMAKICAALARLDQEGIPYISVLTDPTTGGVTASFAMLGDLNIAEPSALIGFAGPRVIEQTIRQKLPEGFQRSEFLLEHGMLDLIVDRREMKGTIAKALRFMGQHPVETAGPVPATATEPRSPARTGRLELDPWMPSSTSLARTVRDQVRPREHPDARRRARRTSDTRSEHPDRRHQRQGLGDGDGRLRPSAAGLTRRPLHVAAPRPPRRAFAIDGEPVATALLVGRHRRDADR